MPIKKKFREVATVPERTPLGLWGGRFGELDAIYLSTGGRRGGSSRVFRHAKGEPNTVWKDEGVPEGAETIAKIIDDGENVYAFFETGGEGTTPVIARSITGGAGGWEFTGPSTVDFVGGRGLAAHPGGLLVGGSWYWNAGEHPDHRKGQLWHGEGTRREVSPGICWEVIVEPETDIIWEFWHGVAGSETEAQAFRDGEEIPAPTHSLSCAETFLDEIYAGGAHEEEVGPAEPHVWKWTGDGWGIVHTTGGIPEHLVWVPRKTGDVLYCVAAHPVEVWEFDGEEWLRHDEIPEIDTGEDHNATTALGFHDERVWLAVRDQEGDIRLWNDGGGADILLQVI